MGHHLPLVDLLPFLTPMVIDLHPFPITAVCRQAGSVGHHLLSVDPFPIPIMVVLGRHLLLADPSHGLGMSLSVGSGTG